MSVPLQLDELNRHMDSGFVKVLGLVHRGHAPCTGNSCSSCVSR